MYRHGDWAIEYPAGRATARFHIPQHASFETEEDLIAAFNQELKF